MKQIREVRKQKGWTQEMLATALGVKRSVISKYESGSISPSVDTLQRIADALGISVLDLYTVQAKKSDGTVLDDIKTLQDAYDSLSKKGQQEFLERLGRLPPFDLETLKGRLLHAFDALNEHGQQVAVEHVEDMTEIPRYKKGATNEKKG